MDYVYVGIWKQGFSEYSKMNELLTIGIRRNFLKNKKRGSWVMECFFNLYMCIYIYHFVLLFSNKKAVVLIIIIIIIIKDFFFLSLFFWFEISVGSVWFGLVWFGLVSEIFFYFGSTAI